MGFRVSQDYGYFLGVPIIRVLVFLGCFLPTPYTTLSTALVLGFRVLEFRALSPEP